MQRENEHSCRKCQWLIEKKKTEFTFYYWCKALNVRIHAIDLDHAHIACTPEIIAAKLQRFVTKTGQKYPRLESVFGALGYKFESRKTITFETITINKHEDGSYKTKEELIQELKELRDRRASIIHPDKNPQSESAYHNEEMAKVNEAFNRGMEIIENRYKDHSRPYKGKPPKRKTMDIIEAFTTV